MMLHRLGIAAFLCAILADYSYGQELPEKVRIATYNIEFFGSKPSGPNRLDRLKRVIQGLDADVIGLQEIDDRAVLRTIFPAGQWQILIDDESTDAQDLAIAVRRPFGIVGKTEDDVDAADANFLFPQDGPVADQAFPRNRDVLFARIDVPGTDESFVLMVHHAKARAGGRQNTDPRRKLASTSIIDAIQTRFDGEFVAIVGDFNDAPDDESLNILETGDPNASPGPDDVSDDLFLVNLTQPLLALDYVSWGLDETRIQPDGMTLNTRVTGSRNHNNATRNGSGSPFPILFDQILITRPAFERFTVNRVMVFNGPAAQEGNRPGSNGNVPIDYASDHTPVVAEFSPNQPAGQPTIPISDPGTVGPIITPPPPPTDQPSISRVRIAALLPNPQGADPGNETINLKNFGDADVLLAGWRLVDRSGNELELSGSIKAGGEALVLKLAEGQVPLNNGGDDVRLFDEEGAEVDRVRYAGSQAGDGVSIKFTD